MGFIVGAAFGPDGGGRRIGRGAGKWRPHTGEYDGCHRRPQRRRTSQCFDHLTISLSFALRQRLLRCSSALNRCEIAKKRSTEKLSQAISFSLSSTTASRLFAIFMG